MTENLSTTQKPKGEGRLENPLGDILNEVSKEREGGGEVGPGSLTGWDNATGYLDKVQDVELLSATGYDYRFVNIHHKVRELLDLQDKLGTKIGSFNIPALYLKLKSGDQQILVNEKDTKRGNFTGKKMDLYDMLRVEQLKEINSLLDTDDKIKGKDGKSDPTDSEWEELYRSGEPIIVTIRERNGERQETGQTKQKDLRKMIKDPTVSAEEFKYYFETIEQSQTQLQMLSTLRDEVIEMHHAENAGHAQMVKVSPGKYIYVPVGLISAANYVRADVRKKGAEFRAACHVHEIGWYEEHTTTLVKIEAEAYRIFRASVGNSRMHEKTFARTVDNCLGLSSGEFRIGDGDAKAYYFGHRGVEADSEQGDIYAAFRHHYDDAMTEARGYGITDHEIGDKIVTDIVGVAYAINPVDWLMTFAVGTNLNLRREDILDKNMLKGKDGKPVFIFDAKRLKGRQDYKGDESFDIDAEWEYGRIELHGIPALTNYIQWRISRGEVAGIDPKTKIGAIEPKEDKGDDEKKEDKKKEREELKEEEVEKVAKMLEQLFGQQNAIAYLDYVRNKKEGKTASLSFARDAVGLDSSKAEKKAMEELTNGVTTDEQLKFFLSRRIEAKMDQVGGILKELTGKSLAMEIAPSFMALLSDIKPSDLKRVRKSLGGV